MSKEIEVLSPSESVELELPWVGEEDVKDRMEDLHPDYTFLGKLCCLGGTVSECAYMLGCTIKALEDRVYADKGITFYEWRGRFSQALKIGIRKAQIQKALSGDTQMLKWLGVNVLGQSLYGQQQEDPAATVPTTILLNMVNGGTDGVKRGTTDNREHPCANGKEQVLGEVQPDSDGEYHLSEGQGEGVEGDGEDSGDKEGGEKGWNARRFRGQEIMRKDGNPRRYSRNVKL